MTLQLSALFALGVTTLAPRVGLEVPYRNGTLHATGVAEDATERIIVGTFTKGKQFCRFEVHVDVATECVTRAKGCRLLGQAPLCP